MSVPATNAGGAVRPARTLASSFTRFAGALGSSCQAKVIAFRAAGRSNVSQGRPPATGPDAGPARARGS
jgi:hypothetical protein